MRKGKITHEITLEIPVDDEFLQIEATCSLEMENDGIGSYEFWGSGGYDLGHDYLIVDHISWDKTIYTENQNRAIDKYLDDNIEEIDSRIVYDYESKYGNDEY